MSDGRGQENIRQENIKLLEQRYYLLVAYFPVR